MDLSDWNGAPRPGRVILEGRYARLEPLNAAAHEADLFRSAREPGSDDRFRYLAEQSPADVAVFSKWFAKAVASDDPLFFAVVDQATGRAEGRQALMRIDPKNGVIEVGSILWGPAIARTRISTEALYLAATYVFDGLGYRRLEWKCNSLNDPSKRAAVRFGFAFEGIFRNHMVVKGMNRDTAWYAMTDEDWRRVKPAYVSWLAPENFDSHGRQMTKLVASAS
jgi:RimJ/RimL family protein N-acetyltransferase